MDSDYTVARHFDTIYGTAAVGFYSETFGVQKVRKWLSCENCGTKTDWRDSALCVPVCSEKCQHILLSGFETAYDSDLVEEWEDGE